MQIGVVAKRVGLSVDAIRFYERNALLRPSRTQGGFRQYGESDVETVAFIRRVQGLGFKLNEIRGLLGLRGTLRANIREPVLVLLINEQGEKEKGRDERKFSWCWCSFLGGIGWRGTERRRAKRAAA